ncbi:macrophage mannose receptor 1-like [Micractinium conductrix]|uniref:Macrophage mannose receptor 1-like n=1 Tax=Micractinium conductrix TaxID=554055 RepID=A0A2P6V9U5_9CHLO|nr:macrophage mannose receptor 1-like [Micractinium conductrix]|eukprot:PSC70831.1 macrophage mannose receptor 1-like [Micractinium conductrix]
MTLASDGVRGIPPCPSGWTKASSSDDGVVCKHCSLSVCQYVAATRSSPAGCLQRRSASCWQLVTGELASRTCQQPGACDSRVETLTVPSVPRPAADPTCPQGALGTLGSTGLRCYSCAKGAPYRELGGSIKCTTGTCPAGYQACADDRPHCWDLRDRLLAAVFELLQDRKSCADFLRKMGYAGWLRPCPVPLDVVVNPPILLGATG